MVNPIWWGQGSFKAASSRGGRPRGGQVRKPISGATGGAAGYGMAVILLRRIAAQTGWGRDLVVGMTPEAGVEAASTYARHPANDMEGLWVDKGIPINHGPA